MSASSRPQRDSPQAPPVECPRRRGRGVAATRLRLWQPQRFPSTRLRLSQPRRFPSIRLRLSQPRRRRDPSPGLAAASFCLDPSPALAAAAFPLDPPSALAAASFPLDPFPALAAAASRDLPPRNIHTAAPGVLASSRVRALRTAHCKITSAPLTQTSRRRLGPLLVPPVQALRAKTLLKHVAELRHGLVLLLLLLLEPGREPNVARSGRVSGEALAKFESEESGSRAVANVIKASARFSSAE